MNWVWFRRLAAACSIALLAACGGGGGGGGGIALLPITTPTTGGSTTTDGGSSSGSSSGGAAGGSGVVTATVSLSGLATYESVPNTAGPLNYTAITAKPIRGAVVEVLNSVSTVVATTTTDANGAYTVAVPVNTSVFVRVKAQLLQSQGTATWDVSVRDNTQSSALYVLDTTVFATGAVALSRNVTASSGWDGTSYSSLRAAGPFAVLDTIYDAQSKVLSVAPTTAFPQLRVFWSVSNLPASGNVALGQIGTTFFQTDGTNRTIYVLGKEDVDTDEYDSSVIAHEWGHYYQSSFSRDDSPGGSHALTDRLDRRMAFSEGWGNAWSGIALGRQNYTDSVGTRQAQGSNIDLSAGPTTVPGWFREASVHSILWTLNSRVGFKPIHDAMTGSLKTGIAVTSIHAFAASFGTASPANASVLAGLLTAQSINASTSDSFGGNESNSGGIANALPLYRPGAIGVNQACVSNAAGNGNKLGNYVYLKVPIATAATYRITATGPSNADPDFVVYGGRVLGSGVAAGSTEVADIALPAGDAIFAINDFNNSSTSTCFTVTIQ